MYKTNKELARIFGEMASYYRFKGDKDRFRVIAYENAARIINHLTKDVKDFTAEELEDIKGKREGIASKIREYIETGTIKKYNELGKEVPHDFLDLLKINGIGPKTLETLDKELGINKKEELIKALDSGEIEKIKGFGPKTIANIKEGLKQAKLAGKRIFLADALEIASDIGA